MENRNGLIAAAMVTQADGYAERDAALLMLKQKQDGHSRRITVGADKAYDSEDFVRTVRELNVTPHVTKNDKGRKSNLDRRTTRQPGYAVSLSRRWLVEKGLKNTTWCTPPYVIESQRAALLKSPLVGVLSGFFVPRIARRPSSAVSMVRSRRFAWLAIASTESAGRWSLV